MLSYEKKSESPVMKSLFILYPALVLYLFASCNFRLGIDIDDYTHFRFWHDSKIIVAAGGTPADIRQAIERAEPGDTIRIPTGTFDFDGNINMDAGINIVGAGMNETILTRTGYLGQPFFLVDGSNELPVRFEGMTMIGHQQSGSDCTDGGISLQNGCRDFRITDIEFRSFGYYGISAGGNARGVVDNCRFIDIYRPAIANLGYGVTCRADGDAAWERPFILGNVNAVFVEDCYFIHNRHAVASNNGSRYVFRHNLVEDNGGEEGWVQAIDAHGLYEGYGSPRGSRSYEVYGNIVNNENTTCWVAIYIRGGDGVIFNNYIYGGISTAPIMLTNERDGLPYPARDQIRELYLWENYYEDSPTIPACWAPDNIVQEDRDYFNYQRPDYESYKYPHPLRRF